VAELAAEVPIGQENLPREAGGCRLTAREIGTMVSVAPYRGREAAVSAAMEARLGVALTGPGEWAEGAGWRVVWTGLGQWFVEGEGDLVEALAEDAAVTEQGDGWAAFRLEGAGAEDVLARLVPVDPDGSAFGEGRVARTALRHVACALSRDAAGFEIMVMRSFAATAAHEIVEAMAGVAARAALTRGGAAV
jgi:heterotetrameric sarcosine oxidase gamma subunit